MNLRLVVALMGATAVIGACVIAEPPADFPAVPARRPIILRADATPPTTGVLTEWPNAFIVPVEVSDARQSFYAAAFIDYNPITGEGLAALPKQDVPAPNATSRVRDLAYDLTPPTSDRCHTIEIVVAFELQDPQGNSLDQRATHTATSLSDGDTISWFYSPNGDPSGCAVIDAGLVPLDASDGGGAQ